MFNWIARRRAVRQFECVEGALRADPALLPKTRLLTIQVLMSELKAFRGTAGGGVHDALLAFEDRIPAKYLRLLCANSRAVAKRAGTYVGLSAGHLSALLVSSYFTLMRVGGRSLARVRQFVSELCGHDAFRTLTVSGDPTKALGLDDAG